MRPPRQPDGRELAPRKEDSALPLPGVEGLVEGVCTSEGHRDSYGNPNSFSAMGGTAHTISYGSAQGQG